MRPGSPAVTAGKTALPTAGRLTRTLGVQNVPGRPAGGAFAALSIGDTERYTTPPVTQTAYAFPCASRFSHGKIAGVSEVTWFDTQSPTPWYWEVFAVATK